MSLPADTAAGDVDIVHSTGYTSAVLDRSKLVVAIHDLSFVTHPEFHTEANRAFCVREVEKAARHAAKIIVPSQNSKRDLQKFYKVEDDRIAVIPYAADPAFSPADPAEVQRVLRKHAIAGDYLLFVGSVEPRKNLLGLVRAAGGRQVVVAGPEGWLNSDVHRYIDEHGLQDRVRFLGYVDRDDLRALYTGARAFVYPSFYEGFGFPVLEAMACGCPLVVSDISPHREFLDEESALLVPPGNPESLGEALVNVLANRDGAIRRAAHASAIARKWSLEEIARHYDRTYHDVIARHDAAMRTQLGRKS